MQGLYYVNRRAKYHQYTICTVTVAANQKYCHGCAKPIHVSAPQCPHCGAPQSNSLAVPVQAQHSMSGHANSARSTSDQKHCMKCGTIMHESAQQCPSCAAVQMTSSSKNRTTAAWLALFLGGIGGHQFYLGNTGTGFLYLIFCWTWIPAIISIFECIRFFMMSDMEFASKYK